MPRPRKTAADPAGPSRRSREPRDTGRAFIAVATRLFAEKGYNGTSIGDLASELSLTTASLYYHVKGKQELLLRVLDSGMATSVSRLEAVHSSELDPGDKLRQAVQDHLHFVMTNQNEVAVFLRERRFLDPPHRQAYNARVARYDELFDILIADAMAAGDIPPGDVTLLRLAILGMINWVVEWYRPTGRLSQAEVMTGMTDLIMDRMLAEPARGASRPAVPV